MRSLRTLGGLLLLGLSLSWADPILGQDWRGNGRVIGWVKDQNGQPVADATVKLSRESGAGPAPVKANKKGYWAIVGLGSGSWNVDVSAPGFETVKKTVQVQETGALQLPIQLQKAAAAAPAQVAPEKSSGAEVVAAVNEGNRLLGEKKFAEARAEYEKALALLPDNAALWKGIAQTYHGEGNKAKTIECLKKAADLDQNDTDSRVLLASLLVDDNRLDEGKTVLEALPPGAVKDPAVYVNIALILMNKNKPDDARAYLTKAIEMDPAQADTYYYRGLASIQMKKNAEAKADFHKYLELAPDGSEAKEVKEMLQALK